MEKDISTMLDKAEGLIRKGDYAKAEFVISTYFNEVPEDERAPRESIRAHMLAAQAQTKLTAHEDAIAHSMKALKLAESIKDEKGQARCLRWLGHIHWRNGDLELAMEFLQQGVTKATNAKDKETKGIIHIEMGNVCISNGDLEQAEMRLQDAIRILTDAGNPMELARAHNNLGDYYMKLREWERAIEQFDTAKGIAKDDKNMHAWVELNKAASLLEIQRYEEAQAEIEDSIPKMQASNDRYGQACVNDVAGDLFSRMKIWDRSEEHFLTAINIIEDIDAPVLNGLIERNFGRMFKAKGDGAKAKMHLEKARDLFREHNAKIYLSETEIDLEELDA